jgi:uncharacterized protein
MAELITLPLFPLGTVLFPGGLLPLKIFEQRYVDMTKRCIANHTGFGVVSAREPTEGERSFASVGTVAMINEWEMPHVGIFQLKTSGSNRFVVVDAWQEKDGLHMAKVKPIENEPNTPLPSEFSNMLTLLTALIENVGAEHFPAPIQSDSASWISMRLVEIMPFALKHKQQLLEINDATLRLRALETFLATQNVMKK